MNAYQMRPGPAILKYVEYPESAGRPAAIPALQKKGERFRLLL